MGTNYGRGIIKQVEELTLQNERLVCENERLRAENAELREQLTQLQASFTETVLKLTAEIERLRAQINKNSGNSSKPPSSDGFRRVSNSREKSGRKPGGQLGHPGKRLELPENLDELVKNGRARRVLVDHTDGTEPYVSRFTVDIDVTIVVTEHRYGKGSAPLGAEVTYGDKIKSASVLLSAEGLIAEERLVEYFSDITEGVIKLSDASVDGFLTEMSAKLDREIETIETGLLNEPVIHVDDTPVRTTEKPDYSGVETVLRTSAGTSFNAYIRTYSNATTTRYTANPQKDAEGVERDGILPRYIGTVIQDHEAKFYNYGSANGTCGSHLCRELRGLHELQKIPWGDEMRRFMSGMNDYKNADLAAGRQSCDPQALLAFEAGYDRLLEKGRASLSALKTNELGYDELRRMLNRLTDRKDNYLLFIRDYKVPFTNNQAERDLRPVKTKQKVSGGFRSWGGVERYTRIRSFISTVKKRKLGVLESIARVFRGSRVLGVRA